MGPPGVGDCRRTAFSYRIQHGFDRVACPCVPHPHQPPVSESVSVSGGRLSGLSCSLDSFGRMTA